MSHSTQQPPAGWYPDPAGSGDERYWDGGTWSQVTRPAGGMHAPADQTQATAPYGQPPMPYGQSGAPYAVPGQQPYGPQGPGGFGPGRLAGWWWRVLATIIDGLAFIIPSAALQSVFLSDALLALERWLLDWTALLEAGSTSVPPLPPEVMDGWWTYTFVLMAVWIIYRTVMVARFGATLGQLATGLRVVREHDHSLGRIGWGPSAVRGALAVVLGQVPVVNLVNVLMPVFTRKNQTIHDMIAKTVVVKK